MRNKTKPKITIRAKIIRANGKIENLGVIYRIKNKLKKWLMS